MYYTYIDTKEEIHRMRQELDKDTKDRRNELARQEKRVIQKEENLDKKTDAIEKKNEQIAKKLAELDEQKEEVNLLKKSQMDVLEGDTTVGSVALQCIRLREQTMTAYRFDRSGGKWYLSGRTDTLLDPRTSDFLHFYARFTADSVFQQESVAEDLRISMDDPVDDEEDIDGTIERGQWPVFRPDMPEGDFVHIDFGQTYPDPGRLLFLQCGLSNGFINIFSFRKEGDGWRLTAYEN